jgi:hypothetical protein
MGTQSTSASAGWPIRYSLESGLSAVQAFVQAGRRRGLTREQCRSLYWETAPLAQARQPGEARARDVDWRERFRAESARLFQREDFERGKAVTRVGWRLHCRNHQIEQARALLDRLEQSQARDLLIWDQLTSDAATDDLRGAIAASREVRHG